jgi:hypothetical protein
MKRTPRPNPRPAGERVYQRAYQRARRRAQDLNTLWLIGRMLPLVTLDRLFPRWRVVRLPGKRPRFAVQDTLRKPAPRKRKEPAP